MEQTKFWRLIEKARKGNPENDDMYEALKTELEELSPAEIQSFHVHFRTCLNELYRWDVWGAAYVMNGGCSDDSFEYWRAMVISLGKKAFDVALSDPDALADLPLKGNAAEGDWEFEMLLYLPADVYQEKTGEEIRYEVETLDDPSGERWDEDTVHEKFPRINKRFWPE